MYVKDIPQSDPNWETLESTALYYNVEPTPGYHLLLVERTPLEQWWPCVYPNLCVEDLPATLQSEERLAWCLDYFEDPEICRSYEAPQTQQELDEHNACSARMSELSMAADGDCPMPTTYPENPEGFDHRVTVTLGAGLDDWVH